MQKRILRDSSSDVGGACDIGDTGAHIGDHAAIGIQAARGAMTGEEEELTTWTLGAIKSAGMVLEGACATPNCNEFARFDLDGLIGRFGADWRVPATLPVPARCAVSR
jgi:hypothetical protein